MARAESFVDRVVGLLSDERVEVRSAAALVLGLAGQGEARAEKALAARIADESPVAQRFVVEALERLGAKVEPAALLPLLDTKDDELREKVTRLVLAAGPDAEEPLRLALRDGPVGVRWAASGLLLQLGSAAALDALLAEISDHDIGEHVLAQLRAEIDRGDKKLRTALARRVQALRKKLEPKVAAEAKGDDPAVLRLGAVLRLEGYLADPESLPGLVEATRPGRPLPLRLAAIAATRRILANPHGAKTDAGVVALIGYAEERDPAVARAALDSLRGAQLGEAAAKKLAALASSSNSEARRLAMERMPALKGPGGVDSLIAALGAVEAGPREAAQRALGAMPEAAEPLLKALAACDDLALARRYQAALRPHKGRAPQAALEALARRLGALVDKGGGELVALLAETLALHAPELHTGVVFDRARKLARAKHDAEALALLKPLAASGARLDDEQRLFLGALGLRAGGRDLLRAARTVDPVLRQFVQLVGSGYPLARALLKDRSLELDDLFTLGFNFVESKDEDEKDLGRELLEAIVARQPRGKLATAAKNKLKLAMRGEAHGDEEND